MGKNDFLTPKAIANRIKSKGLQKLRWYCQLCQKQCRDENGFKCHQTSEGHRRQMELFGLNAGRVVAGYSEEFENAFMEHLRRAHPFSRVLAKNVYNEYITDRHHVHMNSTRWLTLTEFVKYLGKSGQCKVDETEKGWYITLIHKDPKMQLEEERRNKRTEAEREDEERHMAQLQEQIERAKRARIEKGEPLSEEEEDDEEAHVLQRDENEAPIAISLAAPKPLAVAAAAGAAAAGASGAGPSAAAGSGPSSAAPGLARAAARAPAAAAAAAGAAASVFGDDDDDAAAVAAAAAAAAKQRSKMDEVMKSELKEKERAKSNAGASDSGRRLDYWLHTGIVVKVMAKELKEHGYYKQKGVVERVVDRYVGEVAMLGDGTVVRVDQAHLETVIPAPGGAVLVVNGQHRGCRGTLEAINEAKFQAQVRLGEGPARGREVWLEYEDVCKLDKDATSGGGGGGGGR
ncbi:hypothetical protein HYH02_003640 [Chlamydomonas schloesseri]|uniref:C2H2-type domain-containing protein n=1 Tax=Chlamydomonas schloesseri TaxID=2026947 RepID=A0A835WR23_9CHLO|nr:hypothetical protein HYH02_003640 [Chlamydomonas schloesseri]|eukprot:KAG2451864.1 hypothetical protein HYH02_003640 [Chlamydomonas schloesseri]